MVGHMSKVTSTKPIFVMMYGYPGAGKTHFARQLSETLNAAHVHGDRIRGELFTEPRYDKQENELVNHLMLYMTEEFLNAGVSVVFDANASRLTQRRELRICAGKV
jgi:predicted kinase